MPEVQSWALSFSVPCIAGRYKRLVFGPPPKGVYRGFQDPDRGGDEPHPRRPYHRPQRGGDDQPLRSGNPTGPDHRTAPALRAGLSLRGIRYRLYAELRGVRYAGRCGALHAMWKTPVSDLKVRRWVLASSRSEEHTSELQSLMRNSYAVFCLKKKNKKKYDI